MKHIVVKPEKCTGCRLCQLTCSAENFRLNTHKSARIGIVPRFPEGYFEVHLCNQCGVCLPVCPWEPFLSTTRGHMPLMIQCALTAGHVSTAALSRRSSGRPRVCIPTCAICAEHVCRTARHRP